MGGTWSAYDSEVITLREGKNGRRVSIPCTATLRTTLDAARDEDPDEAGLQVGSTNAFHNP